MTHRKVLREWLIIMKKIWKISWRKFRDWRKVKSQEMFTDILDQNFWIRNFLLSKSETRTPGSDFWVGFFMWTWRRWRTKIYLERWTWISSSICNDINRRIDFTRIGFLEQDSNLNSTFENHNKSWKFLEDRFQFISYRSSSKYFRIYFTVISGPGLR